MIVCFLCWHDTESPVLNRNNKYQDLFAVGLGSCKFKGRELLVSTSSVTVLDNLNLSKLCFLSFLNKCCKLIIYLFLQTTHLCPSLGQTTSVDRDVACFSSTRWKTLPSQSTSTPPVLVSCASTFMHSIPTWWQWASTMAVWLSTAWRRRDRSLFTRVQPRLASTQILSGRCEWMAWQWWIGWQKFRMCALFSLISVTSLLTLCPLMHFAILRAENSTKNNLLSLMSFMLLQPNTVYFFFLGPLAEWWYGQQPQFLFCVVWWPSCVLDTRQG